jgi:TRAP transporter 4TM/12TM fusion protein
VNPTPSPVEHVDVNLLVKEADTGGREPGPLVMKLLMAVTLIWALFQLWIASPLPFALHIGVFNDTESRSIHFALAIFLAFLVYPFGKGSSRDRVPLWDWACALVGAFCAAYIFLFYRELAQRPGSPSTMDVAVAVTGIVLLLDATRRVLGLPMVIVAVVFLVYTLGGAYMPELLAHKGASLSKLANHMWLTTEGVYGIALGVSSGTIFVYVLFGSLLDKAGGGNYMMQVSFAALGHLRGGPAKVAVVSSALNGLISGSSVSNVVSGGIFTIPLMKKSGYGGVKAGAIETMSSVNGQIMPPVMGAAAFLMIEYVGIPYAEIIRHAFLPAVLSYIGLFYIVHLEALKLNMRPMLAASTRPWTQRMLRLGFGISGTFIVVGVLHYAFGFAKAVMGDAAPWAIAAVMLGMYLYSVRMAASESDLPTDIDVENPRAMETWPTVKAGMHYLLPIGTLIWCLMVEEMSPALSAFWAVVVLMALMLTQHWLVALFRKTGRGEALSRGWSELLLGMQNGSRNMIGIGIATATAGIVVGAITLTGLGLRMTEFVEFVSNGNVIVMLLFVAFVCLVLGLGVPTTANYVLVATLMAPVVVELGAQSGLIIPLIAVHLFVFYYGIMGDITPPVGLATFAAAAISGEDAIKTGIQGSVYALRTVILPFIWIFNTQLLLIGVHTWWELSLLIVACTMAMLMFTALTMGWFRIRLKWWEAGFLALAVCLLFRPNFFMNQIEPEYRSQPAADLWKVVAETPQGYPLVLRIQGMTLEGDEKSKTVAVQLGERRDATVEDARRRVTEAGLQFMALGDAVQIGSVKFGSQARKAGFEETWDVAEVLAPSGRPSPNWFYLPGFMLIGLVWWAQGRRMRSPQGSA